MREDIASLTLSLRRYAHALLGRWPMEAPRGGHLASSRRFGADQDADDLAHEALLGFWRAGLAPRDDKVVSRRADPVVHDGSLRIALLRRLTILARAALRQTASAMAAHRKDAAQPESYFAWAPEARALPRLPLDSRALLALAVLERLNYDEIGEVLDMSAGQVLAKLARARAQLASEISGETRPFLRPASPISEADLHLLADDLLDETRRAEVEALLDRDSDCARRVEEWRGGAERLRGAFASLLKEPVPVTLNFAPPVSAPSARLSWLRGLAVRLGASLPALRAH